MCNMADINTFLDHRYSVGEIGTFAIRSVVAREALERIRDHATLDFNVIEREWAHRILKALPALPMKER